MSAEGVTQKSRRGFPQSFFVYLSGKRTGLKMQMFYSLEELIFISALIFCAVMSRAGRQIFRTCNPDIGYQISDIKAMREVCENRPRACQCGACTQRKTS